MSDKIAAISIETFNAIERLADKVVRSEPAMEGYREEFCNYLLECYLRTGSLPEVDGGQE